MIQIQRFTFNPFQENTYVLYDDQQNCIVVDPGCYEVHEQEALQKFVDQHGQNSVQLVNTHCHLDHIAGNKFIVDTYKVELGIPEGEMSILKAAPEHGKMYGFIIELSPEPNYFIEAGSKLTLGVNELAIISCPGHSPDHMVFYAKEEKQLIGGDVLFQLSIGRTDLPGGDHNALITNIKEKLWPLPDDVTVHPGHGPTTTIGFEKANNPFLV